MNYRRHNYCEMSASSLAAGRGRRLRCSKFCWLHVSWWFHRCWWRKVPTSTGWIILGRAINIKKKCAPIIRACTNCPLSESNCGGYRACINLYGATREVSGWLGTLLCRKCCIPHFCNTAMYHACKFCASNELMCSRITGSSNFIAHQCIAGAHGSRTVQYTRAPRVRAVLFCTPRCVTVAQNAQHLHNRSA